MSKPLNQYTIEELSPLIEKKEVSPIDVTKAVFGQIASIDHQLNTYISTREERAFAEAEKSEQEIMSGNYRGPLHGIPMALKDNIFFKDEITTMGSKIHKDFIPNYEATVVKKLRDDGVHFTGKLNLHEYAWGATTNNPHFGACHNPWNLDKIPGGSSGGSGAAVAAHLTIASLGTDTGGSIRIPSSYCGIVGLKPTHGRVSNYGCFPLAWSLDHIGPMTKTVKDSAYVLDSISGYDVNDPRSINKEVKSFSRLIDGNIKGMKIGVNEEYFFTNVDKPVEEAVRKALSDLEKEGAVLVDIKLPTMNYSEYAMLTTIMSEPSAVHHDNIVNRPNDFGSDVILPLRVGELFSAVDYLQSQQIRRKLDLEYRQLFEQVDALISPTLPFLPPNIGDLNARINDKYVYYPSDIIRFTGPFNITGLPAISIPCGFSNGLPIGMQIAGPAFKEEVILNIAYAYEQSHEELKITPPCIR